jgi:glycosyltransferase involved in cell wall biosynthesis
MRVIINPIRINDYRNDPVGGTRLRESMNLDDQRLIALAMGRFVKWKGLDLLIKSAAHLELDTPWELWIVGEGPMKQDLEQLAIQSRQTNQTVTIRLFPFAEDVRPFLWAADLFVQPSYHVPGSGGPEGLSMALMEALAAGLPVVVFECGGALDVVKEGSTGWLAPPGDWLALAQAMKKALNRAKDPQIRRNVREMIQQHDVSITAQEYIDVYQRVTIDDNTC